MRCNTGVNPVFLADQHLIAEQGELFIVIGNLRARSYTFVSKIPPKFKLGTGHIAFWYNKLAYIAKRHERISKEIIRRGFATPTRIYDLHDAPQHLINDWSPSLDDTNIVRSRIYEVLLRKPNEWRYSGRYITDINAFAKQLVDSSLYSV